ncbi:MAG: DUF4340 domain-containing protein, partial [Opitutaceae bacterium]
YAQLENRPTVFTVAVPAELIANLTNATEALRERHVLDFDPQSVTAITFAAPVQSAAPITLQLLDPAAGAAAATWQIVRRGEGNQGLQTTPADHVAVQRLIGELLQLEAQAFVSDKPSSGDYENWGFNRPEREITLTLASPSATGVVPPATTVSALSGKSGPASSVSPATAATSVVLRLGSDSAGKIFARPGTPTDPGDSIYAVQVNIAEQFPLEPLAWRERSLPVIPANGRVTAFKLTDLVSRVAIVEATFDAVGQATSAVRDAETVQNVIRQLRPLRAKRFRHDGFLERVVAAGEERAWKYQLDLTIALPGSSAAGEQTSTKTIFFTERLGGTEQIAGSREFDAIFEVEQPLLDALDKLTYGPRDPGAPPPPAKE